MPLNLDLVPGKVNLLNYPELIEVCLLPSGGERLVFISGAAVTNDPLPRGFKQQKSIPPCSGGQKSKTQV